MKKRKKVAGKFILSLIAAVMFIVTVPVVTEAASNKVISLEAGKTYTSYDFTGDGKKDKFKYTVYRNGNAYAKVYINGKLKNTLDLYRGGNLYLCRVSEKNVFLVTENGQFGASISLCYTYSGGKFKKVASVSGFDYTVPGEISGNTLYFRSVVGKHFRLFSDCNGPSCYIKYKASNKKLSRVSRYSILSGTYTATKSFKTSSKESSMNPNGVAVRSGDKVTLKKVYFGSSGTMVQISVNGKTGWVYGLGYGYKNVNLYGALRKGYTETTPTFSVCTGSIGSKSLNMGVTCSMGGTISYRSSNTGVAAVNSNGVITAKCAGTAIITASVKYNNKTYSVSRTVTVKSKKSYGAWSSWSFHAASGSSTQEVRTATFYRYYCFLCPVCGGREPLQGTSDCHKYRLTLNNAVTTWSTVPYSSSNSAAYSYATYKRYTFSLGDGKRWNFSTGNINDHAIGTKDTDSAATVIRRGYSTRSVSPSYYISAIG